MAMLDERHSPLAQHAADYNAYALGRIGNHNAVIACLPAGQIGNTSAASVAAQMRYSFGGIKFALMVGIGGGVPSTDCDIRLGDIVVSKPGRQNGGVVQYDFGKTIAEGKFVHTGFLDSPPTVLLTALNILQAEHALHGHRLAEYLRVIMDNQRLNSMFAYQGAKYDELFQAEYDHVDSGATCERCDRDNLVSRTIRNISDPVVYYGTIASGSQVMRHGVTRDRLARNFDVLCFEMEAAGLMNEFPCIVIRGICDYADSHKNKQWQGYAAATAAAYAKELLGVIPPSQVSDTRAVAALTIEGKCASLLELPTYSCRMFSFRNSKALRYSGVKD
jgi:nucleoside phosphorylase